MFFAMFQQFQFFWMRFFNRALISEKCFCSLFFKVCLLMCMTIDVQIPSEQQSLCFFSFLPYKLFLLGIFNISPKRQTQRVTQKVYIAVEKVATGKGENREEEDLVTGKNSFLYLRIGEGSLLPALFLCVSPLSAAQRSWPTGSCAFWLPGNSSQSKWRGTGEEWACIYSTGLSNAALPVKGLSFSA